MHFLRHQNDTIFEYPGSIPMSSFAKLKSRLVDLRRDLINHELYNQLSTIEALHVLMEQHVFAVWDFMSLLKTLQRELTCVDVPWRPSENAAACRLVNEIVLAEESDIGPDGHPASHFELYLSAMRQAGADTSHVETFLKTIDGDDGWRNALPARTLSAATRNFIDTTFEIIESEDICKIAAAFTFGREELLPDVFQQIVANLNTESDGILDSFEYYLQRHIELDGDEHGAMAQQLMETLCGDDPQRWQAAEDSAVKSLHARTLMWDAIADEIDASSP